jgi:hypothetical protein
MSQEAIRNFQQLVNSRPDLRDKLQSKTKKSEFVKTAVDLGRQNGHNFTEGEVEQFLNSPDSPTRQLSDSQISSSSGGRTERYTYSKPGCTSH